MGGGSAIITPFGYVTQDDSKEIINLKANFNDVAKVRKFIDIGL